jgi:gas vesicle protein
MSEEFMTDYDDDDGPFVVIERSEPGVGTFVTGLLIGAGLALLFAPRTGVETRRELQRRAKRVGDQAQDLVSEVTESVGQTISAARERVGERIDSTRQAVELKRRQVTNAVDAGRAAAQQARVELEQRIAETKAAYKES